MNYFKTKLFITVAVLAAGPNFSSAQEINRPKAHIPNHLANKVTRVRLQSLMTEESVKDQSNSAFQRYGLDKLGGESCEVNIGNTVGGTSGLGNDKDVIVVGDVVNLCR